MMAALDADSISLRPLSLRPGGANPFAGFAKGAGVGLKNKVRGHGVPAAAAYLAPQAVMAIMLGDGPCLRYGGGGSSFPWQEQGHVEVAKAPRVSPLHGDRRAARGGGGGACWFGT